MGYDYQTEKPNIFTEDGQVMFTKIRDKTRQLLEKAGAARCQEMTNAADSGNSWQMLACVDRMVELNEIREVTKPGSVWAQYRVFVSTDD